MIEIEAVKEALLKEPLLHGDATHRAWLTEEITRVLDSLSWQSQADGFHENNPPEVQTNNPPKTV